MLADDRDLLRMVDAVKRLAVITTQPALKSPISAGPPNAVEHTKLKARAKRATGSELIRFFVIREARLHPTISSL